jgi:hypothetical protein
VAKDAGCNPLGVRFNINPKRIANKAAKLKLSSALLLSEISFFDGNSVRVRR